MAKRSDMNLKFDVNQRKHPFPSNLTLYDYLLDKLESSALLANSNPLEVMPSTGQVKTL